MHMSIGSAIKRLRHEKGMTQEQLAECLGVSSRAVSQWECDRTAPDISQLPALCHIFGVTADALLGIDREQENEKIQAYLSEAKALGKQGKGAERTALLREAKKQFPRDFRILQSLADSLVCEYSRKGSQDYDEVFALCHRILAECTDSGIRYEAIDTLATAYGYAGKKDEMRKLAKEMPRTHFSYESFMMNHWSGDADFSELQQYTAFLIGELAQMVDCTAAQRHDDGEFILSHEDRLRLWKMKVALLDTLFPEGDYYVNAQSAESACLLLCSASLRKRDLEEAWLWLHKGAELAMHMDTYDPCKPHTSPILRGYADGGWIMETSGNHSQELLLWLERAEIDILRSDKRYGALRERLTRVAQKP